MAASVTSGFVRAGEGYFSPDGKQIIFQAEEKDTGNPFYQIFTMDLATGRVSVDMHQVWLAEYEIAMARQAIGPFACFSGVLRRSRRLFASAVTSKGFNLYASLMART